jgi:glucan phosphorylase
MQRVGKVIVMLGLLAGCTPTLTVLEGATHACGEIYVEGYFTDTQGQVIVVKAPEEWDAQQVKEFCGRE